MWERIFGPAASDGQLTGRDLWAAVLALIGVTVFLSLSGVGTEVMVSAVLEESFSGRIAQAGFGLGLCLGGIVATGRIVVDIRGSGPMRYEDPFASELEIPVSESPPISKTGIPVEVQRRNPANGEKQTLFRTLMSELDWQTGARKLKQVATRLRSGQTFSKRKAAREVGDELYAEFVEELYALAILSRRGEGPSAGYDVTEIGKRFFGRCLENPFPTFPIVIREDGN